MIVTKLRVLSPGLVGFALIGCTTTPTPVTESPAPAVTDAVSVETGQVAKSSAPSSSQLSPQVLYDILIGEIAGHRGHIDLAADSLGRAAETTRDPRLAERATLAALYAKDYTRAMHYARLWVELKPDDMEARESFATVLLSVDRHDEAKKEFVKLLNLPQVQKTFDHSCLRIAAILSRQKNRSAALEVMETLVAEFTNQAGIYFALAHLAVRIGELDKAATAVDQALRVRPRWNDAALFKARILTSQKDVVRAETFYETYLGENPKAHNLRINYARFLIDQKRWEKAHRQFKIIVDTSPEDVDAVFAVGLLSLQINRVSEAERYLKRTLALRQDHDQARLYLGQAAEKRKAYGEAVKWYAEISPGEYYFEAQARLGVLLAKQGNLDQGRKHLQGITPQNNREHVQLVLAEEQILRESKKYSEALVVLNQGLQEIEDDKDLLYARALIAEKLDKLDLVESDLRTILKTDPKNVHALNALGYTLADRTERFNEAKELLEQALDLKPDDPFILDSMGWLFYRMGNLSESIKLLKKALSLRADAEISAHLGEVLWVMGNYNEATSVWNRALRETPDSEVLLGVIKKFKP